LEKVQYPRVLVADDNKCVHDKIRVFLADWNIEIMEALNGKEAIDLVESSDPDIVLMAVRMEGMDGLKATRAIRSGKYRKAKNLPIIAMAVQGEFDYHKRSLEAGMNECLNKPIKASQLLDMFTRWIPLKLKPGFTRPDSEMSENQFDSQKSRQIPDELPGVSFKTTLNNLGGDLKLYLELLNQYVEEKSDIVPRLRQALDEEHLREALTVVHGLKGVAGNLGLDKIEEISWLIEDALVNSKTSQFNFLLDKLDTEQAVVLESLKPLLHNKK
jgi:CheY-like chemotaxis protein